MQTVVLQRLVQVYERSRLQAVVLQRFGLNSERSRCKLWCYERLVQVMERSTCKKFLNVPSAIDSANDGFTKDCSSFRAFQVQTVLLQRLVQVSEPSKCKRRFHCSINFQ